MKAKKFSKMCTNCALVRIKKALTSVKAYIYMVENTGVEPVTSCLPGTGLLYLYDSKNTYSTVFQQNTFQMNSYKTI